MACGLIVSIYSFFFSFFFFTLPLSTGNTIVHLHLRESAMFSPRRPSAPDGSLLCQDLKSRGGLLRTVPEKSICSAVFQTV